MLITEIPNKAQITIILVYNKQQIKLPSTVISQYGPGILISPVYLDEKPVDYCSNAIMEFKDEFGKGHIFHIDTLTRLDYSGSDFHVITGEEVFTNCNKRKAFRFNVQRMGTAVVNGDVMINVMINDISMRGISIMSNQAAGVINVGDHLEVSFLKPEMLKRITVKCRVVRQFDVCGYTAFGCAIDNATGELAAYIRERRLNVQKIQSEQRASGADDATA
ncbi:MAG: PilZ domain-containing protein [Butyrivibrio sp.]|nr:PilZ domain-containing protein [Butyrivibrio sp.]